MNSVCSATAKAAAWCLLIRFRPSDAHAWKWRCLKIEGLRARGLGFRAGPEEHGIPSRV